MLGQRTIVGISLLCALIFSALPVQGAAAKGTTTYRCVEGGAQDFSDPHCDKEVEAGTGEFGHVEVEAGKETSVVITNEKTKNETKETESAVFRGVVAGVNFEIACSTVSGSAAVTNIEDENKVMQSKGEKLLIKFSSCTVLKPTNCTIKEPIEMSGSSITKENLGTSKTEMGVELKPAEATFGSISYQGEKCALKGKTFNIEGTAVATGARGSTESVSSSGATLRFTAAMTKETLKMGEKALELEGTVTVRTGVKEGKVSLLTVPKDTSTLTTTAS